MKLNESEQSLEAANVKISNLEKAKMRLAQEMEDLVIEVGESKSPLSPYNYVLLVIEVERVSLHYLVITKCYPSSKWRE